MALEAFETRTGVNKVLSGLVSLWVFPVSDCLLLLFDTCWQPFIYTVKSPGTVSFPEYSLHWLVLNKLRMSRNLCLLALRVTAQRSDVYLCRRQENPWSVVYCLSKLYSGAFKGNDPLYPTGNSCTNSDFCPISLLYRTRLISYRQTSHRSLQSHRLIECIWMSFILSACVSDPASEDTVRI